MKQANRPRIGLPLVALVVCAVSAGGCYTKVVSGRGIGADSGELRDAAERDPKVPDRRMVRRQTYLGPEPSPDKKSD